MKELNIKTSLILVLIIIFNDLIDCLNFENENYKERIRFVFSIINAGDSSPKFVNNYGRDMIKSSWVESQNELTAIGARKHYLLGVRNRQRYVNGNNVIEPFLNKQYLYNEVSLQTMNSTEASQSLNSHLVGLFPSSSDIGPKLKSNQTKKAIPHTPIDDFDKITESLGLNAVENNSEVFRIFTIQNLDYIIGLLNNQICSGIDNYYYDNIDLTEKTDLIKALNKITSKYKETLISNNLLENPLLEFNLDNVFLICDSFIKNIKNSNDDQLTNFEKFINIIEFYTDCNILYTKYIVTKNFNEYPNRKRDWDRYLSRVESSKVFNEVMNKITRRIYIDMEGDEKYVNENPKYKIVSLTNESFVAFAHFINLVFNTVHTVENVPASSFNIELFYEIPVTPKKQDYFVRILYNDDVIVKTKSKDFIMNLNEFILDDKEINDFCLNYNTLQIENRLMITVIVISVIAIITIIYTCCLKYRKDDYENIIRNSYTSQDQVFEKKD